ncbi:hypothetical protein [Streptomyces sp. CdTB01]|uniref:hypothetical protein n=1 Tax=Streptomyces sp. CdTB01 TaxID=1725411 RepID=UPI00073AA7B4|nr:hypothetical protein [Streptomyces sp. CdTB01]ALV39213.1 hypothetical protein AS200_44750 [Streptomyces sp. CdTB01]
MNGPGRSGTSKRRSTGPAALACWLVAAFAAVFVCVSAIAHQDGSPEPTAGVTAVAAAAPVSAVPRGPTATAPDGCPAGETCCAPTAHHLAAVAPAGPRTSQAVLPRMPGLPGPATGLDTATPHTVHAVPSLHVLQVLRT